MNGLCMHAWFLMGERKLSANTREQQRRTETAEKRGLMKNIMTVVPLRPTRLVCHEKYLNDGLHCLDWKEDVRPLFCWSQSKPVIQG